jgi:uncharacterized Zn finger protein (UPF0148 family)
MAKFTCPICGKIYYNLTDYSEHIVAEQKAEAESKSIEAQRIKDKDALAVAKKEMDVAYATLKSKVNLYNALAQKYNAKYTDKAYTYTSTLTGQSDNAAWNTFAARLNDAANKPQSLDSLADFISKSLGF